jgi:hypothetical protein
MSNISKILTMASGGGGGGGFSLVYTTSTNDSPRQSSVNLNINEDKLIWAFTNNTASDGYVGYLGYLDIDTLDADWEKEIINTSGGSYERCGYNAAVEISSGTLFAIGLGNWRTDSTTTDVFAQLINASTGASLDADRDTGYSASTLGYGTLVTRANGFATAAGQFDSGLIGSGDMHLATFQNNSGTIVWDARGAWGDSNNDEGGGLGIVQSNGNVFLGISRLITSPDVSRYAGVMKIPSAGASSYDWYREYSSGNTISDLQYTRATFADSNGDCVLVGEDNSECLLARMRNSDGADLGQLIIDDSDGTIQGKQVICDSSDNVYILANCGIYTKVMKFTDIGNGSSDLEWALKVDISSATTAPQASATMAISEDKGLLYFSVTSSTGGGKWALMGLPLDGSFTGTLGDVNVVDSSSTVTVTVGTLTNQAASGSKTAFTGGNGSESPEYNNATRYTETLTEG